jgi:hypothetical protein
VDTPSAHDLLAGHDEPVRRYFAHAIGEGAPLTGAVRLTMKGRIRVGAWLPFSAEQDLAPASFAWRARVGPLRVVDSYADGAGRTDGRLFGRLRLFGSADANTARSAAGRAALEAAVLFPPAALPQHGVTWRADGDDRIAGVFDLPPERPEVVLEIDAAGRLRTACARRWGNAGRKEWGYIPCGCEVHAERRLGALTLPGTFSVGWWFGTSRYAPFFRAELLAAAPG